MEALTPSEIVTELEKHIIGQQEAKRAVAVAIRDRWRRQQLEPDFAKEVNPKNIVMVGPTGVGKTEIARRIASLTSAPFVKVEASKFTEVGYHGRDVEAIVRDLLEQAITMTRGEHAERVEEEASGAVEQRLLDHLLPDGDGGRGGFVETDASTERREHTRRKLLEQLRAGALDDRVVEISTTQKAISSNVFSNMGMDQMDPEMTRMFENLIPEQTHRQKLPVRDARRVLHEQETEKLIDRDKLVREAIERTEQNGIVFLDEIDKVAAPTGEGAKGGPDVSREGVQRDLLPIVEGSSVTTRHGVVRTDHILFIAAGAFNAASVSDMMPELQGRFPIRVELGPLTRDDFVRILTEPTNALTRQQQALLSSEGIEVRFAPGSIEAIAELAAEVNQTQENIGARRLMTLVERLFEPVSFEAPDMVKRGERELVVTEERVRERLEPIARNEDLSRFVL